MHAGSNLWDICLLTENRYLNRQPDNEYVSNIFREDDILILALESMGISCVRKSWEDPDFDWHSVRFVLFRTPWNYFERLGDFTAWLNVVSDQTRFLNPEVLIRWNLNKSYLWDLASKGVPMLPGYYFAAGSDVSLAKFAGLTGWKEMVIKPAISGTARNTFRFTAKEVGSMEPKFQNLLKSESMLLQEFQDSVLNRGEVSLVLIGGKFSHAVLKCAKPGDFRVQDDFGGSLHEYAPDAKEIGLAEMALSKCPQLPVYARVDVIRNNRNEAMLTELELIEPELWFRREPSAAKLLAEQIKLQLDQKASVLS